MQHAVLAYAIPSVWNIHFSTCLTVLNSQDGTQYPIGSVVSCRMKSELTVCLMSSSEISVLHSIYHNIHTAPLFFGQK